MRGFRSYAARLIFSIVTIGMPSRVTAAAPPDPPLSPGVVCSPHVRNRSLADVELTAETTYVEVVEAWGEPRTDGPAGEMSSYHLRCDAWVWLSFEAAEPRRLTRAIVLNGSFVPNTTVLVNELEVTGRRRCNQLGSRRRWSGRQIVEAWGPPDNVVGSGIVRWTYEMADGNFGQVFPGSDRQGRLMVTCSDGAR